ncbi:DUF6647 family protein [Pseudoponticoccus marisrubri]|uniref:DUF6647 domain-containing protein n=1 Tax=Pseudoponticoccus marisrubri TaxID=1685382 RepID=A0A0W7WPP0_9RHOB|nr:DUF6647 family protein [Pseudoponticoccus marisrubri]KUF12549.1 hypothetical protein AVJ23_02140 [Pseudoponticoccus marisrubri]
MRLFPRLGGPILCALMLLTQPARAADPDPLAWRSAPDMAALVGLLEGWLDAQPGALPRRTTPPEIRLIGAPRAASMHSALFASHQGRLRGLYDPQAQTVYLVHPWSARDPFDVGVLLHELVHHRQNGAGHWYCPGAQELPAYRLQQRWLQGMGLEPDVNWIAVVLEAGCTPRDIHPD